jgi:uncharacterized protein (TIGR03086 family)
VTGLVERHRVACDGFARVADSMSPDHWDLPTPCTEWSARDLVEHVIGFHEFLLLRPLGVRANRPKSGPAERWNATSVALFTALETEGALDRATELPGGGESTPRTMLDALTTDVLVHTWDLAKATGIDPSLDQDLCSRAYEARLSAGAGLPSEMYAPPVEVAPDADTPTKLIALCGRDPFWSGPAQVTATQRTT